MALTQTLDSPAPPQLETPAKPWPRLWKIARWLWKFAKFAFLLGLGLYLLANLSKSPEQIVPQLFELTANLRQDKDRCEAVALFGKGKLLRRNEGERLYGICRATHNGTVQYLISCIDGSEPADADKLEQRLDVAASARKSFCAYYRSQNVEATAASNDQGKQTTYPTSTSVSTPLASECCCEVLNAIDLPSIIIDIAKLHEEKVAKQRDAAKKNLDACYMKDWAKL